LPRVFSQLLLAGLALALGFKSAALAQTLEGQAAARLPGTSTNTSAGAVAVENATHGLCLNFHSAPVDLVLDYLSDACGFVINLETDIRGTVDVWSNGPGTAGEAVERLNSSLKKLGCAVTRRGRILTVRNLDQSRTADSEIVTGNDPDAVRKSDEVVTQIIPVRYASVGQLVNNLQPLLPASASLSVNESANALILVATSTDVRRMLKIISALDDAIARVSSIKVLPLRYANATELAAVVQQLFASAGAGQSSGEQSTAPQPFGPPGGGGGMGPPGSPEPPGASASSQRTGGTAAGTKVTVLADERSNSLIVCAHAGLIPTLAQVVERLDRQVNDLTELRAFRLRNADPQDVKQVLQDLFNRNTTAQNNNSPLLGQSNPLTARQTQQQTSTSSATPTLGTSGTSGGAGSARGF
jgi:general secretion pathway protein D